MMVKEGKQRRQFMLVVDQKINAHFGMMVKEGKHTRHEHS